MNIYNVFKYVNPSLYRIMGFIFESILILLFRFLVNQVFC